MSENATTEPAEAPEKQQAATSGDFTPITNQEEFNRAIAERIKREREKFADYSDLKAKAGRLDEIEEANKTEIQRAIDRAEAAEKALEAKASEALRLAVIAKHGIPEEYHEFVLGSDEAELEAKAEKVKTLIAASSTSTTGSRELFVAGEGKAPATALNGDGLESALRRKLGIA